MSVIPKRNTHGHYTTRIADAICARIALGETLKQALLSVGYLAPSMSQVWIWMDKNEEFRLKYERARLLQADCLADRMLEMAQEVLAKPTAAAAYRVASDILKTQAECRNPTKYGPRVTHEIKQPMDAGKVQSEIKRLEEELGVADPKTPNKVVKLVAAKPPSEAQLAQRARFKAMGQARRKAKEPSDG